jgi:16S rRNA (cytidine1402-2'-O)-methyltransferase
MTHRDTAPRDAPHRDTTPEPAPSTLYVVSTPIGNLDDITLRALAILRAVDLIAAEDTRTTRRLLARHGIATPCVSSHSHNERQRSGDLLERLAAGASVAVVSDAGTPGVSDPAALLVSAAVDAGFRVVPVPGASALLAALVVSGFAIDRFHFEGFLPLKKRRAARLRGLAAEQRTVILYESPHRLLRTLRELLACAGDRRVAVCRELTKLFEEILRGQLSEAIAHFEKREPRGEFVIVLEGRRDGPDDNDADGPGDRKNDDFQRESAIFPSH